MAMEIKIVRRGSRLRRLGKIMMIRRFSLRSISGTLCKVKIEGMWGILRGRKIDSDLKYQLGNLMGNL